MFKKAVLSFLSFIILFTQAMLPFSASSAHAQVGPWYAPDFKDFYVKVYDESVSSPSEIFGERYTAAQVTWVIYGLLSFFINVVSKHVGVCLFTMEATNCYDALQNLSYEIEGQESMIATTSFFDTFTSRPISSIAYFKDIGMKLRIIPEAKAQGFGFTAGSSVLELWRLSRNISYAFMVIIIIAMAFMIMFRLKISPQVVISVQSALPKVIISIILITFSYAIAGFLIDLMYVVIGIFSAIVADHLTTGQSWSDIFAMLTQSSVFDLFLTYLQAASLAFIYVFYVFSLQSSLFLTFLTSMLVVFILAIVYVLFIIVLFLLALRTAWLLLKTYVMIILKIIVGPFYVLFGTITPGGGMGSWIRSILADLSVYPTIAVMFFLALLFLRSALQADLNDFPGWEMVIDRINYLTVDRYPLNMLSPTTASSTWNPPLTMFTPHFPLLINLGISFVIITMIPKAAEIIKNTIERRPFSLGSAVGMAVGPGIGAARFGVGASLDRRESGLSARAYAEKEAIGGMMTRADILSQKEKFRKQQESLERFQRSRGRYKI